MSNATQLTKDFYKQRQEATDSNASQDLVIANHVGWNSIDSQIQGFEVATNLPWINWDKVESLLDIGCGYGNLTDFLIEKRQYKGRYLGIDIMPEFIEQAIQLYQNNYGSRFIVGDFLKLDWTREQFDIVISIGGLGVNQDYPGSCGTKSLEYAQKFIALTARLAVSAISLYFPNADNVDASTRKPRMAYYKKAEIEKMVLEVCGNRCEDITFISFPNRDDVKTVAQIRLSH